jgi:hypothetical protein
VAFARPAARACVTARNVKSHLHRATRKLGVTNRRQLPSRPDRQGTDGRLRGDCDGGADGYLPEACQVGDGEPDAAV